MVERRFLAILGLSLALHASLFALTTWQRQQSPVSLPPIIATLRLITLSASGPVAVAASTPAPAAVPPKVRQHLPRGENLSSPRLAQAAGPANVPLASPLLPPVVAPVVAPVTAPGAAPVAATPVATPVLPPAAAAVAPRPQAELLAGYRQRLSELFARQQEYPRVAALRGWEGEVRLRLKVARKGNLLAVHLDHSSGFEVLDQHALAMLEALASLPPLPEGLEASEIQVVVPVNYKLRKTT